MKVKIWNRINNKELIYSNVKSIYSGSIIFILDFADDKKTKLEFNTEEYQIHFIYEK
jgi:hypothetical protein